jgi:hypothetical protein
MNTEYSESGEFNPHADFEFDFDLGGIKDRNSIPFSQALPPVKCHVIVYDISKESGRSDPLLKFTFKVLAGPLAGRTVCERLCLSQKNKPRVALFASRLGLLKDEDFGKSSVKKSWLNVNKQRCIIEVVDREYEKTDGSGEGRAKQVTFAGIWNEDHPDVKDVPREAALPPASFDDV